MYTYVARYIHIPSICICFILCCLRVRFIIRRAYVYSFFLSSFETSFYLVFAWFFFLFTTAVFSLSHSTTKQMYFHRCVLWIIEKKQQLSNIRTYEINIKISFSTLNLSIRHIILTVLRSRKISALHAWILVFPMLYSNSYT